MMTFLEKLTMLMAEKKVSRKTLSTELQIGKNQIKYWEDKGTLPDGSTLIKIARYFDVSVDYLLGLSIDLSMPEMEKSDVVSLYQQLDAFDQGRVLGIMVEMLKAEKYSHKS